MPIQIEHSSFDLSEAKTTATRMLAMYVDPTQCIARCNKRIASKSSVPKSFWFEVIKQIQTMSTQLT
jgi:hypothetical protein